MGDINMTEWGVYLVIVSLLGTAGIIAKPIMKLTQTNTQLKCAVEKLTEALGRTEKRLDEHDEKINNHETRISVMEKTATRSS